VAPDRTELGEAAGRQGQHGRCQPIEGVAGVRTVSSPGEDGVHMARGVADVALQGGGDSAAERLDDMENLQWSTRLFLCRGVDGRERARATLASALDLVDS
jgi:hypothetical protein